MLSIKLMVIMGTQRQLIFKIIFKTMYNKISLPEVKERYTKLKNGEEVFSWVIYPPNFDPSRKYPTLLYCQGCFRGRFPLYAIKVEKSYLG